MRYIGEFILYAVILFGAVTFVRLGIWLSAEINYITYIESALNIIIVILCMSFSKKVTNHLIKAWKGKKND